MAKHRLGPCAPTCSRPDQRPGCGNVRRIAESIRKRDAHCTYGWIIDDGMAKHVVAHDARCWTRRPACRTLAVCAGPLPGLPP